ncbi:hypothetical protein [Paraburkholderia sp. SIMBA_030]|uniref:hypothetical protein n=1 Tax=Paraburkholderia sp. SIMBA_030 TaxID=3085773 RepID=UPI00397B1D59
MFHENLLESAGGARCARRRVWMGDDPPAYVQILNLTIGRFRIRWRSFALPASYSDFNSCAIESPAVFRCVVYPAPLDMHGDRAKSGAVLQGSFLYVVMTEPLPYPFSDAIEAILVDKTGKRALLLDVLASTVHPDMVCMSVCLTREPQ